MAEEPNVVSRDESQAPREPANAKEGLYEKLRLWVLDLIIAVLVIAFLVVVLIGRGKTA